MAFWNRPKTDLSSLENRIVALETQVKSVRLEWDGTYEKMSGLMARFRKRDRDAEKAGTGPVGEIVSEAPAGGPKAELWRRAAHLRGQNGR